jgi:hypothetical protein
MLASECRFREIRNRLPKVMPKPPECRNHDRAAARNLPNKNAAKNLGALRRIVLNLLKLDQSDTRNLPKKRRRAMLDLTYRDALLSLA